LLFQGKLTNFLIS